MDYVQDGRGFFEDLVLLDDLGFFDYCGYFDDDLGCVVKRDNGLGGRSLRDGRICLYRR